MLRSLTRLKRTKAAALEHPRLALYRSIIRAHQHYLPADARQLGDAYVRSEFTLHRDASATFMVQFERQWRDYLTTLRASDADAPLGREMTADEVAALSDEQKVQLRAYLERLKPHFVFLEDAHLSSRVHVRSNPSLTVKIRESTAGPPSVDTS